MGGGGGGGGGGGACRSPLCWTKVGESSITSPDLIRDTSGR